MSNPTTPIHRAPLSQQHRRVITTTSPDAIGAQVTVTIDGVEAKVPFGTTILEAAKNAGIHIPTLCDHPDLDVAGVCRMCVVEVEGQRTLQAACTFPVVNQMKVNTHTPQGPHGPPARARPAPQRALRRVLQLRAQQQLRAAVAGRGVRRRPVPLRPPRGAACSRSTRRATPSCAT